jgi:glycosyltransferase involved in cell wall biosynthesis
MSKIGKLKILDWYVHQGHQYEFFKTGHDFYLLAPNGSVPKWNKKHRPLGENVSLVSDGKVRDEKFDIVVIRSPIHSRKYERHIKQGAVPVAVVQTTTPYNIDPRCRHVVWNSAEVMKSSKALFPKKNHYYIVHGYDPDEFRPLDINKNNRVLTVANAFKSRSAIMGYPLWAKVKKDIRVLDVIGHGNYEMYRRNREANSLEHLIRLYNSYAIYFNPTKSSAMPRSRAEAAMCGMPIVTTNNFDIGNYFYNKQNAVVSNSSKELIGGIKRLLRSEQMRVDYGEAARETAIKHFHINHYLRKWNKVFEAL